DWQLDDRGSWRIGAAFCVNPRLDRADSQAASASMGAIVMNASGCGVTLIGTSVRVVGALAVVVLACSVLIGRAHGQGGIVDVSDYGNPNMYRPLVDRIEGDLKFNPDTCLTDADRANILAEINAAIMALNDQLLKLGPLLSDAKLSDQQRDLLGKAE